MAGFGWPPKEQSGTVMRHQLDRNIGRCPFVEPLGRNRRTTDFLVVNRIVIQNHHSIFFGQRADSKAATDV